MVANKCHHSAKLDDDPMTSYINDK